MIAPRAPGLDEARAALALVDLPQCGQEVAQGYWCRRHAGHDSFCDADGASNFDPEHLRTALTVADTLATSLADSERSHRADLLRIDHAIRSEDGADVRDPDADVGYAVGRIGTLRARLAAAERERDRLAAENAKLRTALTWALGEGEDPGAWPDGVPLPPLFGGLPGVLTAPTDAEAGATLVAFLGLRSRVGIDLTLRSAASDRRICAARRVLAEVSRG